MTAVTDETRMLRESAAAFCAATFPIERVRELGASDTGVAPEDYQALAAQGWLGILVPEAHGGLGLGTAELGVVLEELGRGVVPGPFWSAATLGIPAIAGATTEAIRTRWLDDLVSGTRRVTLALQEDAGLPQPNALETLAEPDAGGGYQLSGVKRFGPDLVGADAVAVVARVAGEGARVFLVDAQAPGVRIEPNRSTDGTSRSGTLICDRVAASSADVLGDWSLVERIIRFGNVGIAAIGIGAAQAVLDQAVAYVKQRVQFGVPIGTFQAVQHPLADVFAEIESARSAYLYAAWAVDHGNEDQNRAVALARLLATQAYHHTCRVSLQAHGGIAFTWEYDLHLHLKRAIHLEYQLGGPGDYEEIIATEGLALE